MTDPTIIIVLRNAVKAIEELKELKARYPISKEMILAMPSEDHIEGLQLCIKLFKELK